MAEAIRVVLEIGPKGRNVVAVAPDWPGLERGAKTGEAALERLRSYLPRYAPIAALAGLENEFSATSDVRLFGEYPGSGSTDFWGISFAFSEFDQQAMSSEELDRELSLMEACWASFDDVRNRVSAELEKGPRGGGRGRDRIVRHVIAAEQDWARKLGLKPPQDIDISPDAVAAHRDAYCAAIRGYHAEGKPARTWPLRYLIRHTAYHVLDHTWEMEDRDLTT